MTDAILPRAYLDPGLLKSPLPDITPLHLSREWTRLLESGGDPGLQVLHPAGGAFREDRALFKVGELDFVAFGDHFGDIGGHFGFANASVPLSAAHLSSASLIHRCSRRRHAGGGKHVFASVCSLTSTVAI
jgi:hypothetical protein